MPDATKPRVDVMRGACCEGASSKVKACPNWGTCCSSWNRRTVPWAASRQTSARRLTVLELRLAGPSLLWWIATQQLPSLLIAFPLVLIPLWLAVRGGLSPLRSLVARVSARAPDDFSPLNVNLPYTELQPLVRTLDELLAKSRQGIARERAIVQDAAHELRTPLAVVTVQAHALANTSDPVALEQAKKAPETAVQRAAHLVNQLLTLARLEADVVEHWQGADMVAVTRQILISVAPLADQRGIEVALESPDRLEATLDLMAFHSVLENL
jgi:two-component system sensor histidine kinase QseC